MQSKEFLIVTGFGPKGSLELATALTKEFPHSSVSIFPGCPVEFASEPPENLVARILSKLREKMRRRTGIGLSYGGALYLWALAKLGPNEFDATTENAFLIDAPLHPEVSVNPVNDFLRRFQTHYDYRPQMARQCVGDLELQGSGRKSRIVTLGTTHDQIVPPETKSLPGIQHISLPDSCRGHDLTPHIHMVTEIITSRVRAVSAATICLPTGQAGNRFFPSIAEQ